MRRVLIITLFLVLIMPVQPNPRGFNVGQKITRNFNSQIALTCDKKKVKPPSSIEQVQSLLDQLDVSFCFEHDDYFTKCSRSEDTFFSEDKILGYKKGRYTYWVMGAKEAFSNSAFIYLAEFCEGRPEHILSILESGIVEEKWKFKNNNLAYYTYDGGGKQVYKDGELVTKDKAYLAFDKAEAHQCKPVAPRESRGFSKIKNLLPPKPAMTIIEGSSQPRHQYKVCYGDKDLKAIGLSIYSWLRENKITVDNHILHKDLTRHFYLFRVQRRIIIKVSHAEFLGSIAQIIEFQSASDAEVYFTLQVFKGILGEK